MTMKTFVLGGMALVFENHLELSQTYDEERASTVTRHADGSARKQTAWRGKIKTTISGNGWIPPGLTMLDYDSSMEMSCIAPRGVTGTTNTITIPAARRSDDGYEPWAIAHVDGERVDTPIVGIDSNHLATLTAVSGAIHYTVFYYPKITVFAELNEQGHDVMADTYNWSIEAREV